MNHENEFDELARRKLAERDFPFQEAHWLDAQRAIAAERKGRRGGALWVVGGAAVLIIAAWLLWPMNETPTMAVVKEGSTNSPVEAGKSVNEVSATELDHRNSKGVVAERASAQDGTIDVKSAAQQRPAHGRSVSSGNELSNNEGQSLDVNAPRGVPAKGMTGAMNGTELPVLQTLHGQANDLDDAIPPPGSDHGALDQVAMMTTPDLLAGRIEDPKSPGDTEPHDPADNKDVSDPAGLIVAAGAETRFDEDQQGLSANGADGGLIIPVADTAVQDPPLTSTLPAVEQGLSLAALPSPQDSTPVTPDPVAAVPPLITPRSPWELSVLFGAFNTSSVYAGGNSAAWEVSQERTYGSGVELMHMGSNFGLGGGFHYGTYADRLRTPEERRSVLNTETNWYFQPVDTTIMIVLGYDSITNSWLTENVDVTINELRMSLDSSYADVLIREARERLNRTSYVEAVGLVDAHLVQGRWSFGIRGGPSIGLLTTRNGSIPSNGGEEITFNDVAVKSMVVGWTARAYVRYRFNAAWSVGIEPAARGQLFDGLAHEGVTRKSSGFGVMLSVSYRLP